MCSFKGLVFANICLYGMVH